MSKLLFFDLETTGVNHRENGIHQISGIIEIDGVVKEKFDFKVKPYEKAIIEQAALDVGKVTKEIIFSYPPMKEVYLNFTKMLNKYVNKFDKKDKFHLVGYNNASFDNQFLREFFNQNGDKYFGSYFWADSIDVYVLASNHFRESRNTFLDFKLKTVATMAGIEIKEENLHEATYDVQLTRNLFHILK